MEPILKYVLDTLDSSLNTHKVSGHDFFSRFPQPEKSKIQSEMQSLLLYAIEMLVEHATEKNIASYYYDYLRDSTLKTNYCGMGKDRLYHWNLHTVLVLIQKNMK